MAYVYASLHLIQEMRCEAEVTKSEHQFFNGRQQLFAYLFYRAN